MSVENADPSWFPRVLKKLEEKYPLLSNEIWAEAISDNAEEQVNRGTVIVEDEAQKYLNEIRSYNLPDAGNSGTH